MQAEIKDAYWKLFDTEDLKAEPGPRLVELVDHRITAMADRYSATYPAAMKCLLADHEGLTAYLRFPAGTPPDPPFELHRADLRRDPPPHQGHRPPARRDLLPHPGLGRPGPRFRGWRGLTMTSDGLRLLQDLRRSLLDPPRQLRPRTIAATGNDERPQNVSAIA